MKFSAEKFAMIMSKRIKIFGYTFLFSNFMLMILWGLAALTSLIYLILAFAAGDFTGVCVQIFLMSAQMGATSFFILMNKVDLDI